jgi:hypothetical protein
MNDVFGIIDRSFDLNSHPQHLNKEFVKTTILKLKPTIFLNENKNIVCVLDNFPSYEEACIFFIHSIAFDYVSLAKTMESVYSYCKNKRYSNVYSLVRSDRFRKYNTLMKRCTTVNDYYDTNNIWCKIPKQTKPKDDWVWWLMGKNLLEDDYVVKQNSLLMFLA